MDSFSVNQTQTSVNPVKSGSREAIQCLIHWLNQEPSDEKPHRLLRALGNESIKKASIEKINAGLPPMNWLLLLKKYRYPSMPKNGLIGPGLFQLIGRPEKPRRNRSKLLDFGIAM